MATKNELISSNPDSLNTDANYRAWIKDLSQRYRQSQVMAACGINAEQLRYYWLLGRDIVDKHPRSQRLFCHIPRLYEAFLSALSRGCSQSAPGWGRNG